MITSAELQSLTLKDLAAMARDHDIAGRSGMSKDDLIAALRKVRAPKQAKSVKKSDSSRKRGSAPVSKVAASPRSRRAGSSSGKTKATTRTSRNLAGSRPSKPSDKKSRHGRVASARMSAAADRSVTEKNSTRKKSEGKSSGTKAKQRAKPSARPTASPRSGKARSVSAKKADASAAAAVRVSEKSKRIREEMRRRSQQAMQNKDLSTGVLVAGSAVRGGTGQSEQTPHKDRVVLIVRDAYWLQADWEITRAAVERVRVAMNEKWHTAQPVLRLMSVGDAASNRAEQPIRDIPIHGGVNSWFIDVDNPPARFRVHIGYLAENDRFYPLCRSNIVDTPKPDAVHRLDRQWRDIAEDYERIYSLSGGYEVNSSSDLKEVFEERLQRPMPSHRDDTLGSDTDAALDRHRALPFDVDAELIVYGRTVPGATVLLSGEPVKLRSDGTFTVRVAMPDKRQVLPIIAQSRDGMKQRTTVIAVERNTKVMEAVDRDQNF